MSDQLPVLLPRCFFNYNKYRCSRFHIIAVIISVFKLCHRGGPLHTYTTDSIRYIATAEQQWVVKLNNKTCKPTVKS